METIPYGENVQAVFFTCRVASESPTPSQGESAIPHQQA